MPLAPLLQGPLEIVLYSLMNLQSSGKTGPKRLYSHLFKNLPDPKEYPDYYILIKEPQSLQGILNSLKNGIYSSPQAVAYHIFLVWSNAREYNEAGSAVYKDAQKLESYMAKIWSEQSPPLPPFSSLPTPASLGAAAPPPPEKKKKHKHKEHKDKDKAGEHKSGDREHKSGDREHKEHRDKSDKDSKPKIRLTLGGGSGGSDPQASTSTSNSNSNSHSQTINPVPSTSKLTLKSSAAPPPPAIQAPAPLRTNAKLRIAAPAPPPTPTPAPTPVPLQSTPSISFKLNLSQPSTSTSIPAPVPTPVAKSERIVLPARSNLVASTSTSHIKQEDSSSSTTTPLSQSTSKKRPRASSTVLPPPSLPPTPIPIVVQPLPPPPLAATKPSLPIPPPTLVPKPHLTSTSAPNFSKSTPTPSSRFGVPTARANGVVPFESRKDRRIREKAAKQAIIAARYAAARGESVEEGGGGGGEAEGGAEWTGVGNKLDMIPDVDEGWMAGDLGDDPTLVYERIMDCLINYTDATGRVLSGPILREPDRKERSDYYDRVSRPNSLTTIRNRATAGEYSTPAEFDQDLHHLFGIVKLFITPESPALYNDLIQLQRLYQELTKVVQPGISPIPTTSLSITSLASVPAGPGRLLNGAETGDLKGIVSPRVTMKDKTFLTHINYKGLIIKSGDWVHILNPDNPAKPIIAQVFKVFKRNQSAQRCMSVCWYYRPEETIHPITRMFYENEVFKTSNFVDHSIEDLIERCCVMFFTRFVRGRPAPPTYTPGMPLYVCEHRYKDDGHSFKKIKSWNSSIPEEVRKHEYEFTPFVGERVEQLKKIASPFARGIAGPGGVGDPVEEDEDQIKYHSNGVGFSNPNISTNYGQLHANAMATTEVEHNHGPSLYGVQSQQTTRNNSVSAVVPQAVQSIGLTPVEIAAAAESFFDLPAVIESKFRQDDSGNILWFTTPAPSIVPAKIPNHSLDYLYWKAQKLARNGRGNGMNGIDVEMGV